MGFLRRLKSNPMACVIPSFLETLNLPPSKKKARYRHRPIFVFFLKVKEYNKKEGRKPEPGMVER
jgi:hypothetical protein